LPYDHVDIQWIELDAAANATDILGGDQGEPDPRNGSSTISPRFVRSNRACVIIMALAHICR
jgi:hypothetical protein